MKINALKNTKILTLLAICISLSTVLRITINYLIPIPNFQPMTDIIIFITIIMGPALGIIHAVLAVFLSNLILGLGSWTISQIVGFFIVSLLASLVKFLLDKLKINQNIVFFVFSGVSGIIYGFIVSLCEVFIFGVKNFIPYYLAGITFDVFHAVGNMIFFIVLYPTLYKVIHKSYKKIKYH